MMDGVDQSGFLSAVVEALPNPVLVINAENSIVFGNSAAENFFQNSLKSLAKLDIKAVVPATSPLFELIENVRAGATSINEHEVPIGTPRTGGERVVDVQLGPVREQPGTVLFQVLPRSMAQKIDRQLTHRSAARTVSGMAAMLAHEIKNPLSGIRGAAQLLEYEASAENRELTSLIVKETDRISGLVNQMEVFSDERPIARRAVNIHVVLSHVRKLAQSGFARDIPIREEYDPSLPPVWGNRDQLVQVILNLVKNAAEAVSEAEDGGRIRLTTAYRPGVRLKVPGAGAPVALPLQVCVFNTGPAIAPDILPHLFDPFVSGKRDGKGLGLALAAKVIGDHGGVIESDRVGDETVFTILLPTYDEEPSDHVG